ncbi:hypothetical protein L1S32_09700 [Methanogenium sp. S4BF]|uniref:hypothetical protein n=1 Tax=Methanogenium sp. S4BF TaxID=1789226 RepID=UPI002415FD20|nr:hypothetical protein [Methanogenium sp. S4BF]WFN34114.1 hypothetical protein L1S32_09700 [Methanogenium sp. S4BF]
MDDAYGIFTTDGETVAGTLNDEYALRLAERLDESTASLYISTKNGVFLLGTAVNVQKKGRRPDTFIYLEKVGWNRELPPDIDLAFIHAFYGRIEGRLAEIEYEVRDLASDVDFFDERHKKVVTSLLSSHAADYSVGRLLLGKEVVCVSGNLSKSVDFVVAVTEKLHFFLSAGFTIVVAKRSFRDADLLVTEKYAGTVHIDLDTERTNDPKWGELYTNLGIFARNPVVRQKISAELSRKKLEERLVSAYTGSNVPPVSAERFRDFLSEEKIGAFEKSQEKFSSSAYEAPAKEGVKRPKESDYGKWTITESDREDLKREYEKHMEAKRKGRVRLLAVLGVFVILLAAVLVLFVVYPGFMHGGLNLTEIPHITPSATIPPVDASRIVTRLNTTPGNIPENLSGFGSAYDITLSGPQNVTLDLNADYNPDLSYYLLLYNQSASSWEPVETTFVFTNGSVTAFIMDSGIYRLFTDRESTFNES